MMRSAVHTGPRLGSRALLLAVVLFLSARAPLPAQEPPVRPPPGEPRDSLAAAQDSIPQDTAAVKGADAEDSASPPPQLVRFPATRGADWTEATQVWERDDILNSGAFSLTDLLERVAGISSIRSGLFGVPEIASSFGANTGRIRILLDGFELDPLISGTYDLSRIELVSLQRVTVHRGLDVLRIELETMTLDDPRPYSIIEAGTGDFRTNLFRGAFLAPRFLGGPVSLGVERLETQGTGFQESAATFNGWAKWALVRGAHGVEVEYRRASIERERAQADQIEAAQRGQGERSDLILRARTAPFRGLVAEAFYGSSTQEDAFGPDTARESGAQAGLRALYRRDGHWLGGTMRHRTNEWLPATEAEFTAGTNLPGGLEIGADLTTADWRGGNRATSVSLRSTFAPVRGIRGVGEWTTGSRGVPFSHDADGIPLITDRTALRLGAEFALRGVRGGVARLTMDTDSVAGFGPDFDAPALRLSGGRVSGWEFSGHLPLFWKPLSAHGWYTTWTDGTPWAYLPASTWRAGLTYHHLPLGSGNLEFIARIEANRRGAMRVPPVAAAAPEEEDDVAADEVPDFEIVPGRTTFDFYFQVRIMEVRAFLRWENITHRIDLFDLPGRTLPGQRLLYGVKWEFRN